jgi:cobalt/nickel transport system ATP-binding protein
VSDGAPLLRLQQALLGYPGTAPLRARLDLEIRHGARHVLLGANGAGKSLLLLTLAGALPLLAGSLQWEGEPLKRTSEQLRRWRLRTGIVFQDPDDQLFAETVFEDVCFGPKNLGLSPKEVRQRAEQALSALGIGALGSRSPSSLSLGQKFLAALAGVIVMQPRLLLLDEPTAGLDPRSLAMLRGALQTLSEQGTTVVVATHDMAFALAWCDFASAFDLEGRLISSAAEQFFACPERIEALGLALPPVMEFMRVLSSRGAEPALSPTPRTVAELAERVLRDPPILRKA